MAKSLQEQLMGAGLIDKKKAKAIKKDQVKKQKQQPKGHIAADETKLRVQAERQAKLDKDKALNRAVQEKAEEKAIQAQIKQLIEQAKLDRKNGEIGYNFADGKKIKKIFVNEAQQQQLARGQVSICKTGEAEGTASYELVPNKIADKIALRDPDRVITITLEQAPQEDDPYADYVIPDDLMW